jgi:hypothetical protein
VTGAEAREAGPGEVGGVGESGPRRRPARRLDLRGPLEAAGDPPRGWGDPEDTDAQRAARYEAARPPHHEG